MDGETGGEADAPPLSKRLSGLPHLM